MSDGRIHLLPPAVADAIAAGEVVERPASVVKELCENAVDAGATRVDVDVDGGGTVRIRVSDDGRGIASAELPLAVARHATSKIASVDDLFRVATLGFRGEALASIAAVSELHIVSRTHDAGAGAQIRCRAAEVVENGAAAAAPGTSVEVRDLFFTTPARLRFLRSPKAEGIACVRAAADVAYAHPEVAVTCRREGRVALRTPGGGGLRDVLRAVLGEESAARLLDVTSTGDMSVTGAICEPSAHRGDRSGLVLIVNGRRVQHRGLLTAIEQAYQGLLPRDRHPYGVVVVAVEAESVDVNVHPSKRDVRFRDEGRIFATVQRACWSALQGATAPSVWLQWDAVHAVPTASLRLHDGEASLQVAGSAIARDAAAATALRDAPDDAEADLPVDVPTHRAPAPQDDPLPGLGTLRPLRALGQSGSAWLVAESPRGVVLVDPHAAHEKILYGELLDAWGSAGGVSVRGGESGVAQLLLIPALVECDPAQLARYEAHAEFVERCGFTLEPFGPNLLRCSAVPAAARATDATRLVRELLDALDGGDRPASQRQHRVAALVACHSAVRLGDALDLSEQQRLLDRLVEAPGGTTCPHGRPTVVVLDDAVLRRAFRRP